MNFKRLKKRISIRARDMRLQDFSNTSIYYLFVITLLLGIVFYDIIGFNAIDEICGLALLVIFLHNMFKSKDWPINKFFLITIGIFLFYTAYSLFIGSNTKKAILMDLIIQMKPYLAFFCVYQLMPQFNKSQKKILQDICLVLWCLFLPIGLYGFIDIHIFNKVIGHPSCYAALVTSLSLTYLYCGNYSRKEKLIFLAMLLIGIASGRSKFYGFYALSVFMIFYLGKIENLKFNVKNTTALLFLLIAMLFVAREKIDIYFVQGLTDTDSEDKDLLARFVLYATSFKLLADFFPFGSGLASFATHASGVYYSNIYTKYGIDSVWGLSKSFNKFIADTYYPSLAQFGVVGVVLFFLFWIYIILKSIKSSKITNNSKLFTITSLIIGYLLIENVADASFTSNRGLFMMVFLGLVAADQKAAANKIKQTQQAKQIHD